MESHAFNNESPCEDEGYSASELCEGVLDRCDLSEDAVLIVVGIHIQAELADRPLARHLVRRIEAWQEVYCDEPIALPVVLTDVWYLNSPDLAHYPVISIGWPSVNALTAYLAGKLPVTYAIDGRMMIQCDDLRIDPRAVVWGERGVDQHAAMDRFADRYLDGFMRRLADGWAARRAVMRE